MSSLGIGLTKNVWPQEDLPSVSVVVIGRNEGERLVRCLESVQAAEYHPEKVELIYVDTDSTDGSCAAAEPERIRERGHGSGVAARPRRLSGALYRVTAVSSVDRPTQRFVLGGGLGYNVTVAGAGCGSTCFGRAVR